MCHIAFVIVELRESAHDAVDGSHRWPRNVPHRACCYDAGHVAFGYKRLFGPCRRSDRSTPESRPSSGDVCFAPDFVCFTPRCGPPGRCPRSSGFDPKRTLRRLSPVGRSAIQKGTLGARHLHKREPPLWTVDCMSLLGGAAHKLGNDGVLPPGVGLPVADRRIGNIVADKADRIARRHGNAELLATAKNTPANHSAAGHGDFLNVS